MGGLVAGTISGTLDAKVIRIIFVSHRSGEILDGRYGVHQRYQQFNQHCNVEAWRRSLRGRYGARRLTSSLRPLLAQGALLTSAGFPRPEPFFKLVNQGLILGEDGQKMSRVPRQRRQSRTMSSKDYLAPTPFVCYEMFKGPLEMVKPWSTKACRKAVYRFLRAAPGGDSWMKRVKRNLSRRETTAESQQAERVVEAHSPRLRH